jgi:hypothetical protein
MNHDWLRDPVRLLDATYEMLVALADAKGEQVPPMEFVEDEAYVELNEAGVAFVLPEGRTVVAVQLYSEGLDGYRKFGKPLPEGLTFEMSQAEVRARLGQPKTAAVRGHVPGLGTVSAWDSFALPAYRLHLQYTLDGQGIRLVSLMRNEHAPA